jgi:hypothetical protein
MQNNLSFVVWVELDSRIFRLWRCWAIPKRARRYFQSPSAKASVKFEENSDAQENANVPKLRISSGQPPQVRAKPARPH